MAPQVGFGNQVALEEAFGKKQQISPLSLCLLAESELGCDDVPACSHG